MFQCPITYFTDNLIFNLDKSCWAVYKLAGYDYDFLSTELKISNLYKTARFLAGVMSSAQILMVPVEQDTKAHIKNLIRGLDKKDPLYEQAVYHATATGEYLEEMIKAKGDANDYRFYILIKLATNEDADIVTNIKTAFQFFIKEPLNAANVYMGLDSKDILINKLDNAIKMAEKWLFSQNQKMRLEPVTCTEIQWLCRRVGYRGINELVKLFKADDSGQVEWKPGSEELEIGSERVLRPYTRDVVNLFSGSIHAENRMLRIDHGKNKTSFQTFLVLTHLPDSFEFPGCEWLYLLQTLNMQAEACIHIEASDYRVAQKKLDGKKREIESQMEHITEARGTIPDELIEGMEYANALENELKNLREPLLHTSITICVAADNPDTLNKRAETIINEYEDMNFIVERPLAHQLDLFYQCIPSAGCIVNAYKMQLTPVTLASGVIGATHELGDNKGFYIGTTGQEDKAVFLNMGLACLQNKSAAATFYGNLGVGKSFNANLLVVLNVLYGGYGLIFDPKAERGHWETDLKMLEGLITTVTLSSDPKNKGKLDPYNLYREDRKEADELAVSVIVELLNLDASSLEHTAILAAQKMIQEDELPSMNLLVEKLAEFPKDDELRDIARHLHRRLKLEADSGMIQLIFGDGSEEAINLDNRLNILQIDKLKLPSPSTLKEDYTKEENLSVVLMGIISNFAKKFAMVKRDVFSLILFDESWMLAKTSEGLKLYDFLARMGRSLFTGCIFNGHSVTDIPTDAIENTISYKFCFQTNSNLEAKRMCDYLGIEDSDENKEILKTLGNGECLFRDLDGHVGILKFDVVFEDLMEVFSTTPKAKETDEPTQEEEVEQ